MIHKVCFQRTLFLVKITALIVISVLAFDPLLLKAQVPPPNPDDMYWSDQFGGGGIYYDHGQSRTLCVYRGELMIGGMFEWQGSAIARNIVAWDGNNWHALGSGVSGIPYCLATFGDKLVIGGALAEAGGTHVDLVAAWDGEHWDNLGGGLSGYVSSMVEYHSRLYAAGSIGIAGYDSTFKLVVWDGSSWKPSTQNFQGLIYCLAVFQDNLYAGGDFTHVGDSTVRNIARYDDTVWSPVLGGTDSAVVSLAADDLTLFVAGRFDSAGALSARHVAAWNGEQWLALGAGVDFDVRSMTMLGDSLIIQGGLTFAGPDTSRRFLAWHNQTWSVLPSGPEGYGYVYQCASYRGKLVATGRFAISQLYEYQLGVWDGAQWKIPYNLGCDRTVGGFGIYNGKLIVCGNFDVAGGIISPSVAAWDGYNWHTMSDSSTRAGGFWGGHAALVFQDELYVGGNFQPEGTLPIHCLGAWNGNEWRSVMQSPWGSIGALCIWHDKLFAGGTYSLSGDTVTPINSFDGSSWEHLGSGVRGKIGLDPSVYSIIAVGDSLIVSGNFDSAGLVAANDIAMWNGSSWSSFGDGLGAGNSYSVRCLDEFQGFLYAGGSFNYSGSTPVSSIAKWNGFSWEPLSTGIRLGAGSGYVNALTVYENRLIAGGLFDSAGGVPARNIAAWDGSKWTALGSGTDTMGMGSGLGGGRIYALSVYNGNLMVGGEFSTAGGKVSSCIAMWTMKSPADVSDEDTIVIPGSFYLLQNYPNPFNPSTTIEYTVSRRGRIRIEIFNQLGQRVAELVDAVKFPGSYDVTWNGTDNSGRRVASGVYFYQLRTDERVESKKMVLLK